MIEKDNLCQTYGLNAKQTVVDVIRNYTEKKLREAAKNKKYAVHIDFEEAFEEIGLVRKEHVPFIKIKPFIDELSVSGYRHSYEGQTLDADKTICGFDIWWFDI